MLQPLPLTKRQRDVLDFIREFVRERGYSPSFQEIADHFGFRAISTVHEHIQTLHAKGYVRRSFDSRRGIELIDLDAVWQPASGGEFEIPPGARYVPISALPQLFHTWLQKRQTPDFTAFPSTVSTCHG